MVFKSFFNEHESKLSFKYECCQLTLKYSKTVFAKKNEERCWKTVTIKSWAYCKVQFKLKVKAFVWWVHQSLKNSRHSKRFRLLFNNECSHVALKSL